MNIERAKHLENAIPLNVLKKLEPYRPDIGEVMKWNADFAHQKYHNLDAMLHLRYYDFACFRQQQIIENMDYEDLIKYPKWTDWWDMDLPTYDRVERSLRLHDTGRYFVENGVLKPEDHHYGSLFIATLVDPDPVVCEAVLQHTLDVLPDNASEVSRYTRDLDRIVGAGYVGLIRIASLYGFEHPMLEEKEEDKVINDGVMMSIKDRHHGIDESKAREFFWTNVYPFFEAGGQEKLELLGVVSKIMLDRIKGRDYTKLERPLTNTEETVLQMDGGAQVIEGVMPRFGTVFSYKVDNTLDVLLTTRGAKLLDNSLNASAKMSYLTSDEQKSYLWS